MNLFDLQNAHLQRAKQCDQCPDSREKIFIPPGVAVRSHRCHATPHLLCAGPNRPAMAKVKAELEYTR